MKREIVVLPRMIVLPNSPVSGAEIRFEYSEKPAKQMLPEPSPSEN
jgi:hypothetical protein